ncbi:hypothetical protein L1887_55097 [Cichorium endivia]|nr:hypothetical protein L1887_55097 [Cichorium endivia]
MRRSCAQSEAGRFSVGRRRRRAGRVGTKADGQPRVGLSRLDEPEKKPGSESRQVGGWIAPSATCDGVLPASPPCCHSGPDQSRLCSAFFFTASEARFPQRLWSPERGGLLLAHKADFLAIELGDSGQNRTDCAGSKVDAVQLGHCLPWTLNVADTRVAPIPAPTINPRWQNTDLCPGEWGELRLEPHRLGFVSVC